jgi:hypothetical protein
MARSLPLALAARRSPLERMEDGNGEDGGWRSSGAEIPRPRRVLVLSVLCLAAGWGWGGCTKRGAPGTQRY